MAILIELHAAIQEDLKRRFPNVNVLPSYPKLSDGIAPLPALIVEFVNLREGDNSGLNGGRTFIGTFQARLLADPNNANVEHVARVLALEIAEFVSGNDWNLAVGVGRLPDNYIERDRMWAEADSYVVWLIEWTHTLYPCTCSSINKGIPGAAVGAVRFDLEQALTERELAQAQANLDLPWNYALLFNALIL
ncbi:MAG: hypothetical protein FWH15_07955 [Betaproteobacteria bacterium]|nr:hypothetical protein [Betaproteobacteria bacterium]